MQTGLRVIFRELRLFIWSSFLYWYSGAVCGDRFCLLFVLLIQLMFVSATGAILVCYPVISHPRGTLASRSRVAQTANGVIRVQAPGLTSSAAPVWTGVRSCGLSSANGIMMLKYILSI
jgi:hypothetical protein